MTQPLNIWLCETAEQAANLCAAEALVVRHGYTDKDITEINFTDSGEIASVGVGADDDGMARYVLNFAL